MSKLTKIMTLMVIMLMSLYIYDIHATETVPGAFTTTGELATPEITVLGLYDQNNALVSESSNITPNTKHSIRFELTNASYAFDDMIITVAFFSGEDGSRSEFDQAANIDRTSNDGERVVFKFGYQNDARIPLEIMYSGAYGAEDVSWDDSYFDNDANDAYTFDPTDNSYEFAIHFNMSKVIDYESFYYIGVLASQGISGQEDRFVTYGSKGPYFAETYLEFAFEETSLAWTLDEKESVSNVSLGYYHSMTLTSESRLFIWGNNSFHQLGDGTTSSQSSPKDITNQLNLSNGETITGIAANSYHSAIITSEGRLFTWGYNVLGQLGDGTTTNRSTPVDITSAFSLNPDETFTQISLGTYHTGALTSEGRLFTWGYNVLGQLGDGTTTNQSTPTDMTSNFNLNQDETISTFAFGENHGSAITSEGRVFTWGANNYGQLGDGTTTHRSTPTDITNLFGLNVDEMVIKVELGFGHSSAITSEGRVFTWGANNYGQLGDGTTTNRTTPIDITSAFNLDSSETISDIDLGYFHSSAVTSNGRLFMWGYNGTSQLGDSTRTDRTTPVDITSAFNLASGETISKAFLGYYHSAAITSNDRMFTWGQNSFQLGDGTTTSKASPNEITENFNFPELSGTFLDFDGESDPSIEQIPGTSFTFIANATFNILLYADTTWTAEDPDNEGDFLQAYMVDSPDSQQEFQIKVNDSDNPITADIVNGFETTVTSYDKTLEAGINGDTLYFFLTANRENFQNGSYSGNIYISVVIFE